MRHCYACKKTLHEGDDWSEMVVPGTSPVILCAPCAKLATMRLAEPATDTNTKTAIDLHEQNVLLERECQWLAEQVVAHEHMIADIYKDTPNVVVKTHTAQDWRSAARATVRKG